MVQEWMLNVETLDSAYLESPGVGWISLDRTLAAALAKLASGELGRQITRASATAPVSRGRALLAIVFRYYAAGNSAQVRYDINHLRKLTLKGDNLEAFQNTCTMVLSELSKPPDPDLLQTLYFRQVHCFKPCVEDVVHYKRAKFLHSPDYSFE